MFSFKKKESSYFSDERYSRWKKAKIRKKISKFTKPFWHFVFKFASFF